MSAVPCVSVCVRTHARTHMRRRACTLSIAFDVYRERKRARARAREREEREREREREKGMIAREFGCECEDFNKRSRCATRFVPCIPRERKPCAPHLTPSASRTTPLRHLSATTQTQRHSREIRVCRKRTRRPRCLVALLVTLPWRASDNLIHSDHHFRSLCCRH